MASPGLERDRETAQSTTHAEPRRPWARPAAVGALALVALTGLAACSDDKDNSAQEPAQSSTTTKSSGAAAPTTTAPAAELAGFCAEVQVAVDGIKALPESAPTEQRATAVAQAAQGLSASAPDSVVATNLQTIATGFTKLASGDTTVFSDPTLTKASNDWTAWMSQNCNIDVNG